MLEVSSHFAVRLAARRVAHGLRVIVPIAKVEILHASIAEVVDVLPSTNFGEANKVGGDEGQITSNELTPRRQRGDGSHENGPAKWGDLEEEQRAGWYGQRWSCQS